MDLIKILRGLIILWIVLLVVYTIITPGESGIEWDLLNILGAGVLLTLLCTPLILLYLLKPIGKPIFVIFTVFTTLAYPLLALIAPSEEITTGSTAMEEFIDILLAMIDGAIIAMLFLTPLKDTFAKKHDRVSIL